MGSNSLETKSAGDIVAADDPNQYKTAFNENLVPRNSSGVPTDGGGGLGSSTHRWDTSYIKSLVLGEIASGLKVEEDSGELIIKVGDAEVSRIGSSGIDGSGIKGGTIDTDQLADGAVAADKIKQNAVGRSELQDIATPRDPVTLSGGTAATFTELASISTTIIPPQILRIMLTTCTLENGVPSSPTSVGSIQNTANPAVWDFRVSFEGGFGAVQSSSFFRWNAASGEYLHGIDFDASHLTSITSKLTLSYRRVSGTGSLNIANCNFLFSFFGSGAD